MSLLRRIVLLLLVIIMIAASLFEVLFWFGTPPSALTAGDSSINVNGVEIAYTQQGHGPAVLLLHSGAWSGIEFDALTAQLQEHYTVYRVDLPGFGKSDKPQLTYSLDYLTSRMTEFVEQFPEKKFHIVGASIGGTIALQLAAQFPQRITSLTLIDPFGFGSDINRVALVSQIPVLGELLFYPNRLTFDYALNNGLLDYHHITTAYREQLYAVSTLPKASRAKLSLLRNTINIRGVNPTVQKTVDEAAAQVKQPVLILWGEQDSYAPINQLAHAQSLLPQATVVTLLNTGHFAQLESADLISQKLDQFLN